MLWVWLDLIAYIVYNEEAMTVLLENETNIDIGIEYEKVAREIISAALEYLHCPYECEINILLTDDEGIRKVNRQLRDIDAPTDVLSFPAVEFIKAGDFSVVEDDVAACFDVNSGELLLGDIMISLPKVQEQAREYNHSVKREYAFLIAHSMLHLSGYDHMTEEDRIEMERLQDEILQSIGYTRDII